MSPPARVDDWPPMTDGAWDETHRLILATYAATTDSYFAALVGNQEDIALLQELAAATNSRLRTQRDLSGLAIGSDELVFNIDYAHIINGSFCYPGQGGRFHDRTRGAWYAALEIETCLAEVIHHRSTHLAETGWPPDVVDYQDYICALAGRNFADLRTSDARTEPLLDPDNYQRSQELALSLLGQGAVGVVYPAVRRSGGTNVACFRPAVVAPVHEGRRYRVEWTGSEPPTVTPF